MTNEMIPLPEAAGPPQATTQWPRLEVGDTRVLAAWWDGHGTPATQPSDRRPRSPLRPSGAPLPVRLVRAPIAGALLGVLVAAIVFGVWPARHWWMGDWHWAIALGAVLLLALVSLNAAALVLLGIVLLQGVSVGARDLLQGGMAALSGDLHDVGRVVLIAIAARVVWQILLVALWALRRR